MRDAVRNSCIGDMDREGSDCGHCSNFHSLHFGDRFELYPDEGAQDHEWCT